MRPHSVVSKRYRADYEYAEAKHSLLKKIGKKPLRELQQALITLDLKHAVSPRFKPEHLTMYDPPIMEQVRHHQTILNHAATRTRSRFQGFNLFNGFDPWKPSDYLASCAVCILGFTATTTAVLTTYLEANHGTSAQGLLLVALAAIALECETIYEVWQLRVLRTKTLRALEPLLEFSATHLENSPKAEQDAAYSTFFLDSQTLLEDLHHRANFDELALKWYFEILGILHGMNEDPRIDRRFSERLKRLEREEAQNRFLDYLNHDERRVPQNPTELYEVADVGRFIQKLERMTGTT